jgi:hypothetical protein
VLLDTLAYLKIWEDIFVSISRFEILLSIPFSNGGGLQVAISRIDELDEKRTAQNRDLG